MPETTCAATREESFKSKPKPYCDTMQNSALPNATRKCVRNPAAGLWVTAAIGLACGTGMYMAAMITTFMVLLGLEVLHALIPRHGVTTIELSFSAPDKDSVWAFIKKIRHEGMEVQSYELRDRHMPNSKFIEANIQLKMKRGTENNNRMIEYLNEFQDVRLSAAEG